MTATNDSHLWQYLAMPKPSAELLSWLESLPQPHILLDARYTILAANTAYNRHYGGQLPAAGRTCYEVSHHFDRPCDQAGESCPLAQAQRSGQRERVLHLHHTPKGEEYVDIELVPLRDSAGRIAYFVERMQAQPATGNSADGHGLVGHSHALQTMLSLISRVAPSSATVLLLGESGTGKEMAARALHEASARSLGPLVPVECASLTETLFESELFGHEKGAFTGASTSKPGLIEAACGGTLFLDEVGDIPLAMQVKLLRLLETGTYRRVGSTALRQADIRVVAATHRDLAALVREGRFREDLFYRLSVFPIRLPPLRERLEDLPLLAAALLARLAPDRPLQLTDDAISALAEHRYSGNVRELRNVLERITLLCDGERVESAHVRQALAAQPDTAPREAPSGDKREPQTLAGLERTELLAALREHRGSRAQLAARLGISERSLYRKLKALTASPAVAPGDP